MPVQVDTFGLDGWTFRQAILHYNFLQIHGSLRITPAIGA